MISVFRLGILISGVIVLAGEKELITAQALSETLDLSVETIWRYTREKKIPSIKLSGRQYRYRLADVVCALSGSAVWEKETAYGAEHAPQYTYQDYLEIPEEPGHRFEILDGLLVKDPSPNVAHQRVSRRLQRILEDYFGHVDPKGEVFNAPLDVTIHDITVVQPDLFYVSGEQKQLVKETRIDGAPSLIVEVLSPATSRKDRLKKMAIYQKAQVEHYWLVSPEEKTLECFMLINGVYALLAAGMDDDLVVHQSFGELSIDLKALW